MKVLMSAFCAALTWCAMTSHATRQHQSQLAAQVAAVSARSEHALRRAVYAESVAELGDRVIDLPEDARVWHTTLFTSASPSPREKQLLGWFDGEPQLRRLKEQTHFHHYTPTSSIYSRYGNLTSGGLPVVVLQDASGTVIYKVSGEQVPSSSWPMLRGMIDCIRAHCPDCPRPKPKPEPTPEPDDVPLIPDVVGPNEDTPTGRDDTLAVTIAVFVLSLAGGFIAAAKKGKSLF